MGEEVSRDEEIFEPGGVLHSVGLPRSDSKYNVENGERHGVRGTRHPKVDGTAGNVDGRVISVEVVQKRDVVDQDRDKTPRDPYAKPFYDICLPPRSHEALFGGGRVFQREARDEGAVVDE